MDYENIAFIPLRGGSKSIPLKNIKIINERPLAYWTLDAATTCKYIEKVFVSTDSEEIKKVVEDYDSNKIAVVGRSKETAQDNSSTESAMLEFVNQYSFKNIVLIQVTSPLLETGDLDKGFEMLLNRKYDSILSAVRQKRFIWSKNTDENYYPQNYDFQNRPLRQNFEGYLVENGAFYITSKERLLASKCRISGNIGIVEMKEETYFEIDELSDWIIVEELLKKRKINKDEFKEVLKDIKLLITDSDGVLTDGGMYYSENGDELKKFNTKDGMGVQLLREHGIKTIIITGENVEMVKRRGKKLNIEEIYLGIKEKAPLVRKLAKKHNIELSQIAYIGDDINDLEAIKIVGFGCSICDGMEKVKNVARYITKTKGGQGALREVAELILKAKLEGNLI
ncbi:acylneuraminate cytidylyltransferase [Anaeromicrobium sediminis]|uniref:N-acylneuraminate cytidylyltransferase n=1 Tax=Anaeromicrobium sediminis TaxID=1478221 RepID=A0A267MP19_9FIRM|nr:acylneuraminate cytidylyltransferase [Anaeromicrobium sediminis]PAB60658.1 acylneuraminate cytidylyltransferase [Anaeromicrobium sediminis]